MSSLRTLYIKDEIFRCEDIEDLKENIFPLLESQRMQWEKKINEIIEENQYTNTKFAELCGTSRQTVIKWRKGSIPKNRETFLAIGLAANYDLEQMNQLLQRYGRYPELYSKSLEDCVCMFVMQKKYGAEALTKYKYILSEIKTCMNLENCDSADDISTKLFDEKLSQIKDEDELESFIKEHVSTFSYAYHKFYAYVLANILSNSDMYFESLNEMSYAQEWSSSLKQCVSAIRQKKWYPTRNKIISLGIHLGMDGEQINEMLELAHMEPLCAKNLFESVIMFVLEDASLNDMLERDDEYYDVSALYEHTREILKELDMPELDFFLSELEDKEEW